MCWHLHLTCADSVNVAWKAPLPMGFSQCKAPYHIRPSRGVVWHAQALVRSDLRITSAPVVVQFEPSMESCRYCQKVNSHFTIFATQLRQRHFLARPLALKFRRTSTRTQSLGPARPASVKQRGICRSILRGSEAGQEQRDHGTDWKLLLWGTLDVTATLGSVGGAVAFLLTQEALLIGLPLVLPLLALYASRRRESLKLQVKTPA